MHSNSQTWNMKIYISKKPYCKSASLIHNTMTSSFWELLTNQIQQLESADKEYHPHAVRNNKCTSMEECFGSNWRKQKDKLNVNRKWDNTVGKDEIIKDLRGETDLSRAQWRKIIHESDPKQQGLRPSWRFYSLYNLQETSFWVREGK